MTTRAQIVAEARTWIGTPYQHQASLKGVGCDCIGLIIGVARVLGIPEAKAYDSDLRYKGYGRPPNPKMLIAACDEYLDRVPVPNALPGDIALGRIEKEPQHFGILSSIDPPYIIHSYTQVGKVTENRADENWQAKVLRIYRYRGLDG